MFVAFWGRVRCYYGGVLTGLSWNSLHSLWRLLVLASYHVANTCFAAIAVFGIFAIPLMWILWWRRLGGLYPGTVPRPVWGGVRARYRGLALDCDLRHGALYELAVDEIGRAVNFYQGYLTLLFGGGAVLWGVHVLVKSHGLSTGDWWAWFTFADE
jgi:hypothetical protein